MVRAQGDYLNVGLERRDPERLSAHVSAQIAELAGIGRSLAAASAHARPLA